VGPLLFHPRHPILSNCGSFSMGLGFNFCKEGSIDYSDWVNYQFWWMHKNDSNVFKSLQDHYLTIQIFAY
jgi:hypothetical protein